MLAHFSALGLDTPFDRFDQQKPHCGFGLAGTCCRNCNMGPCRITPKSPRGVCGADADLIVARNLLRCIAGGAAAHGARGREIMLALRHAADGKLPILGAQKVLQVARALGVFEDGKSVHELAAAVADVLLEDLGRVIPGAHTTLHRLAPAERIASWSKLGILPLGAYHEVFEALHHSGVGTDGSWRHVMQQFLRVGLAFAWSSVVGSSIAMDCLLGPPKRGRVETHLGSLREGTVNLALHGHSPLLAKAIVSASRDEELIARAQASGAQGIRLYGICCSGLSALYRLGDVHPLSNAMGAELVLGTGALDAWVADVQDIFPAIMNVARCCGTEIVTTHDAGRLPGARHIGLDRDLSNLDQSDDLAKQIVGVAIEAFQKRASNPRSIPSSDPVYAEIGFSAENVLEHFGGSSAMLERLVRGDIRGIVNLVGCNNPKLVYERAVVDVARRLLARDVVVLTNGCASFPLLKLGYCSKEAIGHAGERLRRALTEGREPLPPVWHLGECLDNARATTLFRALADAAGEPLRRMPFAFASPEWSNEKGVGAALGFRLLGINSYHCIDAPVAGSDEVRRFLSEETLETLGAAMVVIDDPVCLADRMIADIDERRANLAWY